MLWVAIGVAASGFIFLASTQPVTVSNADGTPAWLGGPAADNVIATGGIVAIGAWLVLVYFWPRYFSNAEFQQAPSGADWLAFGLLVSAAGMVGDLAESLLKRDAAMKDSSSWLPGFGGVLDIFDSLLVAAPVAYFLLTF